MNTVSIIFIRAWI